MRTVSGNFWFSAGNVRLGQGRDKAIQYYKENPEEADKLRAAIVAAVTGSHPDTASVASDPVSIDAEDFEEDEKE